MALQCSRWSEVDAVITEPEFELTKWQESGEPETVESVSPAPLITCSLPPEATRTSPPKVQYLGRSVPVRSPISVALFQSSVLYIFLSLVKYQHFLFTS